MKHTIITAIIIICGLAAFAQSDWQQAHINYTVNVPGSDGVSSMLIGTMNVSVKDSTSRTEIKNTNKNLHLGSMQTDSFVVIMNSNTKNATMLRKNLMGNEFAVTLTPDSIKERDKIAAAGYDVKYIDGTKTIAGHLCKKAIVTIKNDKKELTVWYAPDIKIPMDNRFIYSKIDGLPLEYEFEQNYIDMNMNRNFGFIVKFTCTYIDNKPVEVSVFKTPEGYSTMSLNQFNTLMGGAQH